MFGILSSEINISTERLSKAFKYLITDEHIKMLRNAGEALTEMQAKAEHDNAMAPAIYLNKQIDKVAPHKSINKRGKFKRSSRKG